MEPVDLTPELSKRNVVFGLVLFGLFWLIFAGTVAVAFIYLAAD